MLRRSRCLPSSHYLASASIFSAALERRRVLTERDLGRGGRRLRDEEGIQMKPRKQSYRKMLARSAKGTQG